MPPTHPKPRHYIPSLDGLRAIAVIMVVTFHCLPLGFSGGFLGVDLFFLLSGHLITDLLLKEQASTHRIHLRYFYIRRALRLTPALSVLVIVYLIIFWFISPSTDIYSEHLREATIAYFYMANWARAFDWYPPYFYLSHTWSLAIEEQFYLLWPICLTLACRLSRKPAQTTIFVGSLIIITIWLWRFWLLQDGASFARVYNGLDTRADALMAGAITAGMVHLRPALLISKSLHMLAVISICLFSYFAMSSRWDSTPLYIWQLPLIYLASGFLIIYLRCTHDTWLTKTLSLYPLAHIGRISYGIYLWHVPIFLGFFYQGITGVTLLSITLIASFLAAQLSFVLVERPALRLKSRFTVQGSSSSTDKANPHAV